MIIFLGEGSTMLTQPASMGGRPVIRCLLGLFDLASCSVRSMLEAKAGIPPRRHHGVGSGTYDQWEDEPARADHGLSKDNQLHNILIITDGADPERGLIEDDGDNGTLGSLSDDVDDLNDEGVPVRSGDGDIVGEPVAGGPSADGDTDATGSAVVTASQ